MIVVGVVVVVAVVFTHSLEGWSFWGYVRASRGGRVFFSYGYTICFLFGYSPDSPVLFVRGSRAAEGDSLPMETCGFILLRK